MLSLQDATDIVQGNIPLGQIYKSAEIREYYVFLVLIDNDEAFMDPFYCVNMETGEFRDFSILEGPPDLITEKFADV